MKFLFYFLLVPTIFSFLHSNTNFERQEVRKQIMKHKKILYSNSGPTLRGEFTRPVSLPLIEEEILVTECLFSNCYNYQSNGGAISVNIASGSSEKPKTKIESSTFHECCTFLHDSKGGALFIQSSSFQSRNNCFSTCSSIFGVFCYYEHYDECDCDINQSIFHTNAESGIGRGSVVVCSECMKIIDNNFTSLIVSDDGAGLISTVSLDHRICRNVFQGCKGKSTIYIDIMPNHSIFQLLNFIENFEKGNGIISIANNYKFSKCFFHNSGPVLINSGKGTTHIFQCVFDSALQSSDSIFIGSVINKDPVWNADNGKIRFGINTININSKYCQPKDGGDVGQIFPPTRTPYFQSFSPNLADICILTCFGVLFIGLVFTIVYFFWYCICSKPNLKSSIEYLKIREADQYKISALQISNSDSIFDLEESRNEKKKKKKSKKKKNMIDSDDEKVDDGVDEENVDTKSIKTIDLSEDEDESKNKSDAANKKKAKSKKKEKSKSKSKKEDSELKSEEAKKTDSENKEINAAQSEDELSIASPESDKIPTTIINSSSDLGIPKEMPSSEPHKKPESDPEILNELVIGSEPEPEPESKIKTEPELKPDPDPELNIESEPEPETKSKSKTEKNHKSKSKHKSHSKNKTKTEPDPLSEEEIDL